MESAIWFVLGVLADLVRSLFLPISTDWIKGRFPKEKQRRNREENLFRLEVMEKLERMGKDPKLVDQIDQDIEKFNEVLVSQREAFLNNTIEVVDSAHMTQSEMNDEAYRRADVAERQLEQMLRKIMKSSWASPDLQRALDDAQESWLLYARNHAKFEAAGYAGGSIQPLIYASSMEVLTISRIGELNSFYKEQSELCGD